MVEALSEETINKIKTRAKAQYEAYKNDRKTLSVEQKKKQTANKKEFMEMEEKRAEKVQKMQWMWGQADVNNDGRLNAQEFAEFTRMMKTDAKENGDWFETDDKSAEDYQILIKADDNNTELGFRSHALLVVMTPWMQKFQECMDNDKNKIDDETEP